VEEGVGEMRRSSMEREDQRFPERRKEDWRWKWEAMREARKGREW
jgi:hypothetical protein